MNDTPRPVATNDDSEFSLTIQEVAARYEQAGYPRTIRTLQRYCKSGHLDALKKPTLLGDMYLVTPHSVDRHIAQIGQMEGATLVATGRDEPRSAATSVAYQHKAIGEHEEDTTSDDTSR
ncbi:MAG: helix-turn-helix domain-containing protein, partial [Pseudorhodoplanes sp.]|nr:helix-turn-helix domain-containing protein [Pseudorhodoplanes sp.]